MKLADLYIGAVVEELMCDGPIGSGKVTPMRWQRARVTAVVKRKSKFYPLGHVKVSVLRDDGSIAVRDEVPIDQLAKYLRLPQTQLTEQVCRACSTPAGRVTAAEIGAGRSWCHMCREELL